MVVRVPFMATQAIRELLSKVNPAETGVNQPSCFLLPLPTPNPASVYRFLKNSSLVLPEDPVFAHISIAS
jgi:hypothetical protein